MEHRSADANPGVGPIPGKRQARRRSAVRRTWTTTILALLTVAVAFIVSERGWAASRESQAAPEPGNTLIVYGDMATFYGPGKPDNCILRSRFHRGE
jgi:hypothetical protein